MQVDLVQEARRQAEICNACRYCEGYCAVFPALHANRAFSDGDITQLANLCHNCRGCYYACQYTAPHAFDINLPAALAEVRQDSWEVYAYPSPLARRFQKNGMAIVGATLLGFTMLFALVKWLGNSSGDGFYAAMSHNLMVAVFAPAFLFPMLSLAISLRRYWAAVGGRRIRMKHMMRALAAAANMRNLSGGHGEGCNFEDDDRFSHARRRAHHYVFYGFLLCLASTSAGTILHYLFDLPAPYSIFSVPKLLGIPGGIMLSIGTLWMIILKRKADPTLGVQSAWGGEIAFIALLGFVAFSGLVLFTLGTTALMPYVLALHLGSVLSFFLLMPFTKMAHGFYRIAALVRDAQEPHSTG